VSDIANRVRHDNTVRAEVSDVLTAFLDAVSADEIASAIARSVCSLARARSVVYISAIEGTSESSRLAIGTYGSSSMLIDYEYWRATAREGMSFGTFRAVAETFGWKDLDTEFVLDSEEKISEGSKLYCRKLADKFGIFHGYLCIESSFNPFDYAGFDDALFVLSVGGHRFFQAQGEYGSQSVILQKLIHDINGSLSVIGLQSELLRLKSNIENHFVEAQQRIKSALEKADASVRSLNEFSHLFYPESAHGSGYVSSALPGVALSAAFSSLTLNADQLSRIHVNSAIPEYERVHVKGIALYWIYCALINAWVHPFLGSETGEVEVFVDLKKTGCDPGSIDLTFSSELMLERDIWLDMDQVPDYGAMPNVVMLMPPIVTLEKMVNLFGGHLTVEKTDSARSITIGFPCFTE
jgi:hypothetical protein